MCTHQNLGDSNEYTPYTIFNINTKYHPKLSQIGSYWIFQGTQERVRNSRDKRVFTARNKPTETPSAKVTIFRNTNTQLPLKPRCNFIVFMLNLQLQLIYGETINHHGHIFTVCLQNQI